MLHSRYAHDDVVSCSESSDCSVKTPPKLAIVSCAGLLSPECSPKRINMTPKDISLGFKAIEAVLPSFIDVDLRKERRKARL